MKKSVLAFLGFSLLLVQNVFADNYTATLFEQNSKKQTKMYTLEVKDTNVEAGEFESTYKDNEGNVVVQEKATIKGSDLVKFEIDHKQLGQKGVIEVKDGKAYFTKITSDGKSSTKDEKIGKTFVTSSNFRKFVKDNWETIKSGKDVEFRYGVWDRQETVGFEIFKEGTEKIGEEDAIVVKMKPSSFLIAALVKPIFFKFTADGSKLLELNGRVAPKKKDGSNWKDLDAEVVYVY